MKAHYNKVSKSHQKRIRNEVAKEFEKQSNDMTMRVFKMFCVALHKTFGFGKVRISRVLEQVEEIAKEREHDEVFWAHIDRYCKGIGFEFDDEDYEKMDK